MIYRRPVPWSITTCGNGGLATGNRVAEGLKPAAVVMADGKDARYTTVPGIAPYPPTAPAILKIGRYMAMTSPPMVTPRKSSIKGSIREVRLSTAWSTSSS